MPAQREGPAPMMRAKSRSAGVNAGTAHYAGLDVLDLTHTVLLPRVSLVSDVIFSPNMLLVKYLRQDLRQDCRLLHRPELGVGFLWP